MLKISDPNISYFIGFIQADGCLSEDSGNRGRLSIELNIKDADIIYKIQKLIPVYSSVSERVRDTNFSTNNHSITLKVFNKDFREFLITNKIMHYGVKHEKISPPNSISVINYFRGLIDGNGSIGYTKDNLPFISLCIASESIAQFYLSFIKEKLDFDKIINRNKRDNIYNIVLFRTHAVEMAKLLYYKDCLSLDRKCKAAKELVWNKPHKKVRSFRPHEDEIILNKAPQEASILLNRTIKSVTTRKWRLTKLAVIKE